MFRQLASASVIAVSWLEGLCCFSWGMCGVKYKNSGVVLFFNSLFAFSGTECLKIFATDDLGFRRKYRMRSVRRMYRMCTLGDFRFPERCCWGCESVDLLKQSWATRIRAVKHSVTPHKTRVLSDPCLLTGYFKTLRNSAPLYNCELLRF
jgi:hypothetical protein